MLTLCTNRFEYKRTFVQTEFKFYLASYFSILHTNSGFFYFGYSVVNMDPLLFTNGTAEETFSSLFQDETWNNLLPMEPFNQELYYREEENDYSTGTSISDYQQNYTHEAQGFNMFREFGEPAHDLYMYQKEIIDRPSSESPYTSLDDINKSAPEISLKPSKLTPTRNIRTSKRKHSNLSSQSNQSNSKRSHVIVDTPGLMYLHDGCETERKIGHMTVSKHVYSDPKKIAVDVMRTIKTEWKQTLPLDFDKNIKFIQETRDLPWRPMSVYTAFTNIPNPSRRVKKYRNSDDEDDSLCIPYTSCFGKINMRRDRAWVRNVKKPPMKETQSGKYFKWDITPNVNNVNFETLDIF